MVMNPSGGLAGLVAALEGGMDPGQAFSIAQLLEDEQRQRMAQRTERLGGLAALLTQAAGGGMDYQGAEAMAQAQPGPAGPAVQQMLSSLYPQTYTPSMAAPTESPVVGTGSPTAGPAGPPAPTPTQQSPVFTGNPQAQTDLALQQMQLQQGQMDMAAAVQPEADWGGLIALLTKAKGKGRTPDQAIAEIFQANPSAAAAFSADQGRLTTIVESIFGQSAVQYAGGVPAAG